jgi:hypothetical protein
MGVCQVEVTASPLSRFAWPGSTLRYHVHAEGAEFLVLAPSPDRLEVRLDRLQRGADALDADLVVRLRGSGLD